MKKLPVLIAILLASFCHSQITVINTGTSENLVSVSNIDKNYLVSGYVTFLAKCYGECNTVLPLVVPSFPNPNYAFSAVNRPDTNFLYMTVSSIQNLNLMFWKSSDGGISWSKKFDTINPSMYQGATVFFDTLNGISFVDNFKTIKTNNGFKSYTFGTWGNYLPVAAGAYGDSTVIVSSCGGGCGTSVSGNRASSWKGLGDGTGQLAPKDFEFLNKDTIFGITGVVGTMALFLRSFDGGLSWNDKGYYGDPIGAAPPNEVFLGLCVKKKNEIYVTARNGYSVNDYKGYGVILKTTDLGNTWSQFVTPFKQNLNDMKFLNDSTALVCGDSGLLFKWNIKRAVFTGIKENKLSEIEVGVFPNPVKDKLYLEFGKPVKIEKIIITNALGQIVITIGKTTQNSNEGIDLSLLTSGIYYLRIVSSEGQRISKIVKE